MGARKKYSQRQIIMREDEEYTVSTSKDAGHNIDLESNPKLQLGYSVKSLCGCHGDPSGGIEGEFLQLERKTKSSVALRRISGSLPRSVLDSILYLTRLIGVSGIVASRVSHRVLPAWLGCISIRNQNDTVEPVYHRMQT